MIQIEEAYNFHSIDKKILIANVNIERTIKNISKEERGFLSQKIIYDLRTFIEYIAFKIYLEDKTITEKYNNITTFC